MGEKKSFYYCKRERGNLWKVSWIEHRKLKCKYVQCESDLTFLSFSQLKAIEEISTTEAFALMGLPLKRKY